MVKPNIYRSIINDDKEFEPEFLLKYGKRQIIFGGNYFANRLPNTACWLIWDKKPYEARKNNFADCEIAWTNMQSPARIFYCIWQGLMKEQEQGIKRQHPTQKPIKVLREMQETYSEELHIIADLFLGSGSTLIACKQTNRICYGIELDERYCDVILRRYKKLYPDAKFECLNRKFDFKELFKAVS